MPGILTVTLNPKICATRSTGRKLGEAKAEGVEIIDEAAFDKLCGGHATL